MIRAALRLPLRAVVALVRPAASALDVPSIKRSWQWAQDGRTAARGVKSDELPIVTAGDGDEIDLIATAAAIRERAERSFASGRLPKETYDVMRRISPYQTRKLIEASRDIEEQHIVWRVILGTVALIVCFLALLFVTDTTKSILSAAFFFLLAAYLLIDGAVRRIKCDLRSFR